VDTRSEIREFLTSRRANVAPEDSGLPWYGDNRRVPGLRREEVALLAGVSVVYYTRLERGNLNGVSQTVLDALARALQLDDAERAHLFDLARAAQAIPQPSRRSTKHRVRPSVQRILDAVTAAPAYLRNGRGDILAANQLGYALYSPLYASSARPVNTARFVFLDPRAPDFFVDWDRVATEVVAVLRSEAGRDPHDRGLSELVGELSLQSEQFRTRWAAHNVRFHDKGTKRFHHPIVGDLTLTFETMQLTADTGLTMAVYTAEPGSKSEQALNLLASWTATAEQAETTPAID
jgi:transcriptional regulator with XRE-family HTH domain